MLLIGLLATAAPAPAAKLRLRSVANLPPNAVRDLAIGPGGEVWMTSDHVGHYVARISRSGRLIRTFPVPGGGRPASIVRGPDGAMWFTLHEGNAVVRITREGEMTRFDVPTPGAQPRGIALGPDGALWVTLFGVHRVARLTTSGLWQEFSSGLTPGGEPLGITPGPDGAVWFTEARGSRIVRITPDGAVRGFQVSNVSGPEDVALGIDRNLWFTEDDGDRVGRVTPGGSVREFQAGIRPGNNPFNIAPGPDDAMWFTESVGSAVARVTVDGGIREYKLPRGSTPRAVITGPDGMVWLALAGSGRVVRFRPPLAPVVPARLTIRYRTAGGITRFSQFTVRELPQGARVVATCRGRGCPLRRFAMRGKRVNLRPRIRALGQGAHLDLRVQARGYSTMVRLLSAGSADLRIEKRCIAPKSRTLRKGCG